MIYTLWTTYAILLTVFGMIWRWKSAERRRHTEADAMGDERE